MEQHETARRSVAGYIVVLLGIVGWVVGSFLPLYRVGENTGSRLYQSLTSGSPLLYMIATWLYLFGAVAAILVSCVVGLRSRFTRRATEGVLLGAVLVWSLVSASLLLTIASASHLPSTFSKDIGYWCLLASVVFIVLGTVMVLVAARRQDMETGGVAPREVVS